MSKLRFFSVDFKTALVIADKLRAEDVMELETASGTSAQEAVFRSLASSEYAYAAFLGDEPHSLFGVGTDPSDPDVGIIWMVGTPAIERGSLATFRAAREFVRGLLGTRYKKLWNYADTRNTLHLRWLKLLGFNLGYATLMHGVPFVYFDMERPCVNSPVP